MQTPQSTQEDQTPFSVLPNSGEFGTCAYVDRRGRACGVHATSSQGQMILGAFYCRRHVTVASTLSPAEDLSPDSDDRSMSLAGWVSRDLDGPIQQLLSAIQDRDGGEIVTGRIVGRFSAAGSRRDRRWQSDWKLIDHTGILVHISIGVDQSAPDRVVACVDGRQVNALTPPWISQRDADVSRRNQFYYLLLRSIQTGLAHRASVAIAS